MTIDNDFTPKWIAWEVTGRCNLDCVHCRSSSNLDAAAGDWTLDEAYKLIDDITDYASPVLVLSGGEPLTRPDLFDIASYGTSKGLRMCIATNGLLIDDEVCEKMKQSQIKMVSLSLDGSTAEIHDNFRNVNGAFEGCLRGIEYLKKHNIPFLINSSFTKRNQGDIPNVYKLAKELGATAWYMFMIVPTGRGEDIMEELISTDDYDEILNWHFDVEQEENELLMRPTCAPHYYRVQYQRAKEKGIKHERRALKFGTGGGKGCIAGQTICLIDRYGEVQPCSYFPHSAGNVKKEQFKDIWENATIFKNLRDFTTYKGRCGECEFVNICGGCRARADAVHHDYLEEEPFCDYVPVRTKRKNAELTPS